MGIPVPVAALVSFINCSNILLTHPVGILEGEAEESGAINSMVSIESENPLLPPPTKKIRCSTSTLLKKEEIDDLNTLKYFRSEWRDFTNGVLGNRKCWLEHWWEDENLNLKNWLEFKPDATNIEETQIRCRICGQYFHSHRNAFPNQKPTLSEWFPLKKQSSFMNIVNNPQSANVPRWKGKFRSFLLEHINGKDASKGSISKTVHGELIELLRRQYVGQQQAPQRIITAVDNEANAAKKKNPEYAATATTFRAVNYMAHKNLPFSHIPSLMDLLRDSGAKTGQWHRSRRSAVRIIFFISEHQHQKLLKIICNAGPVAIITDDASDYMQFHYMAVLFRAVGNDGIPITYFYKLLDIGVDHTSESHKNAILESFKEDDRHFGTKIYAKMRENLVGFGADGASTNFGKKGGLHKLMNDFAEHGTIGIHCYAHRLQLAIGKAWHERGELGFVRLEEILSNIYKEFSQSPKRYAQFRKAAKSIGAHVYSLSSPHKKARWVAADERALTKLLLSWPALIQDRKDYAAHRSLDTDAVYLQLLSRKFLAYAHFVRDILAELASLSKYFQYEQGVIIGIDEMVNYFVNKKLVMYAQPGYLGRHQRDFLDETVCYLANEDPRSCQNIPEFFNTEVVTWHGIALDNSLQSDRYFRYDIRELYVDMIESLRLKLMNYFPHLTDEPSGQLQEASTDLPLSIFNFLLLKRLPKTMVELDMYKESSSTNIRQLCLHFKLKTRETLDEWAALWDTLITCDDYDRQRHPKRHVGDFWSWVISGKKIPVPGENILYLLKAVLVQPSTSSDAERIFSILKHIKGEVITLTGQ
jgi:hypothetical protein